MGPRAARAVSPPCTRPGGTADLFSTEEERPRLQLEAATGEEDAQHATDLETDELASHFNDLTTTLAELDIDAIWSEADFAERRVLVEELVEEVSIFPDHLEVKIAGSPRINVRLSEVGLKESANVGVGGGIAPRNPHRTRSDWVSLTAA